MQSLDVISVNLWQIVISLLNLIILFLLVKKYLFGPVNKMLDKRKAYIDGLYLDAENLKMQADENRAEWEEKLKYADEEADRIILRAAESAKLNEEKIISNAKEKADNIVKQAENKAETEMRNAKETIKKEIVDVSSLLASKIIMREIKAEDHKELINEFIDKIGESDESIL